MNNDLLQMVSENETILYHGKPDKKTFIFESVFNVMLPFAIVWAIFDSAFFAMAFNGGMSGVMIPFLLLHMMPVWLYLGNIIFLSLRYKNTYYVVTDRAIYTSEGVFSKQFTTKMFAEMSHIDVHRGIFDQWFNVGDVVITTNQINNNGRADTITISNIANYMEVFNLVKKLQQDIYSDVMYPNDLRPNENHGYNTKYKG